MAIKLIIDTDPGIDDAMAILAAFNSPEVEVIGLTTLYGNVPTRMATRNAIFLREFAKRLDVPVAEGSHTSLRGAAKERIADFVHGQDGFGNTGLPPAQGSAHDVSAADFIVASANAHPGEVVVLALAACTNLALALQLDPGLQQKLSRVVVLGGAFFVNGNVNPAAEANFYGDPDAANVVLGSGLNVQVVGLDVTHSCSLTAAELEGMRWRGKHGTFLADITKFYLAYHQTAYQMDAVYLHDPAAFAAVVHPEFFTWTKGSVLVLTDGAAKGHSIMDVGRKNWVGDNDWLHRPSVRVALGVQQARVVEFVLERMTA